MNRTITRRWVSSTLAVSMTFFALALPKPARAGNVVNLIYPFEIGVFIPCADGGAGDFVILSGNLHETFNLTFDNAGGVHAKIHLQPQGISGVGLFTGNKYQGTGVTQEQFNGKIGETYTFVNNFRIIGQGPGNNFLVKELFHVTINANGEVTSLVDNISIDCK